MPWYVHFAYFVGGAFLANALPHLLLGMAGQPFQTPFASPPFRGLSSPTVNVTWALVNLAFAYLMLVQVGTFDLHIWSEAGACFVGFGTMAVQSSRSFARIRQQTAP